MTLAKQRESLIQFNMKQPALYCKKYRRNIRATEENKDAKKKKTRHGSHLRSRQAEKPAGMANIAFGLGTTWRKVACRPSGQWRRATAGMRSCPDSWQLWLQQIFWYCIHYRINLLTIPLDIISPYGEGYFTIQLAKIASGRFSSPGIDMTFF